jgi:Ca-activated chloride channel family protein
MKLQALVTNIALFLLGLAVIQATNAADLYKWTDGKGQMHYTSVPPPEAARKPQQIDPANPGNATALPTQAAAGGATNAPGVLFILDASGSMKAKIGNQEKMAIAKDVMTSILRDLPDTIQVGLEVYGHRAKGDCGDIELIAPVGRINKTALTQRIQAIDPKGMTPITQALQVAAEQLKTAEQETTVVLVSDGEETCKGDPCAAVGSLL